MKNKRLLAALLASCMFLGGCDALGKLDFLHIFVKDPGQVVDPDNENEDHDEEDIDEEEDFEHLTTNPIMSGSYSGTLMEIQTGTYLETNSSYGCAFKPSDVLDKTMTYVSKNPDVATIELGGTDGTFFINTHVQGDTIISGYDVEGTLVLRQLVQVRNKISKEKIGKKLYNVDKWVSTGVYGTYTLLFVSDDPITGSLVGYDDFEDTSIVFDLSYEAEEKMYDFNFYRFGFVLDMDQYNSRRSYVALYVSVTGDQLLIYYSSGTEASLLEMFRPVSN